MAKHCFKTPIQLCLTVLCFFSFATADDFCKIPTKLELVFLVDNSDPYNVEKMKDLVPIADDLHTKYPGSKFGLALFSDFECQAWHPPKRCLTTHKFHHNDL